MGHHQDRPANQEAITNKGRIDLTVKLDKNIYIIKFKVDGEGKALAQIKAKNYHEKYLNNDKT
ncbi:MAG: PD-(D/E)XK nuclease domain-containing protein [Pseudomonadota bacterium]|nr:PD-(D/E)XK nuclease domain-containing protein [Pseudomonadota bacterium]